MGTVLLYKTNKMIQQLIKEKKGPIIDVRTPAEFMGGNAADSINIPLQELPLRVADIKQMPAPYILCCASGGRSGQAQQFLAQQSLECYNAGSWLDVNYIQSLK